MQYLSTALLTVFAVTQLQGATALDAAIDTAIHRIERGAPGTFTAENPRQHLRAHFYRDRTEFRHSAGGSFAVALAGEPAAQRISARGTRVEMEHGGGRVIEWYVNQPEGIEQGFTVMRRGQTGAGPLVVALDVTGDYAPAVENGSVVLRCGAETRLSYGSLISWDADGRRLPSRAEVAGRQIRLIVDDSQARYPVTVDPIFQEPALVASDAATGDRFGRAVAISGDTAVVGAPAKSKGVVYIFKRVNGSWVEQTRLLADPDSSGTFGYSVAISGDTILVGQPIYGSGRGAVHVYTASGAQWVLRDIITPDGVAYFGWSIAFENDTAIVGAPGNRAFAFVRANGEWTQQALFTPAPIGGARYPSEFGTSVALSGDRAVIGAANGRYGLLDGGVVEVFVRSGTVWSREAVLRDPDRNVSSHYYMGFSVAISGDLILAGAPEAAPDKQGAVYAFTRSGSTWSLANKLTASDAAAGARFGTAVALSGNVGVVGAPGLDSTTIWNQLYPFGSAPGATYLQVLQGTTWVQTRLNLASPPPVAGFGNAVALSGNTVLAGSPITAGNTGQVESFRIENVSLLSNPAGRTFTLSGAGCGTAGTFVTPYSGFWTNCTVQWQSPQNSGTDTRYTFLQWADANTEATRTFQLTQSPTAPSTAFAAAFRTEYLLTTQAVPVSGGAVTGNGWYTANTIAAVAAIPNPGFVFAGFSGGLSGVLTPQTILMSGPRTVAGSFATTPPAIMSGIVSAKAGTSRNRVWNIALTNGGPGIAYNAQLYVLMFVQTFGTPCTALPVRTSPPVLPASLGSLNPGASATLPVSLDFSGCPTNARFTVSLGYMSNGGASGGLIQLVNQFQ